MCENEIVISTYNNPKSLKLCLHSLLQQNSLPQAICIADDGSGPETAQVINDFATQTNIPVRHVWHKDNGFEKSKILNAAVLGSRAKYIIFTDGDVVFHPEFVARHLQAKAKNRFLVGGMIRLSEKASRKIESDEHNLDQVFSISWLRQHAERFRITDAFKARPWPVGIMSILEITLVPPRRSLGGCNCSMYREDFISVNGYDERIQYGGQDKELGERLKNSGLRAKSVRYTASLLHLYHERPYADPKKKRTYRKHILKTRKNRATWATVGIHKTIGHPN